MRPRQPLPAAFSPLVPERHMKLAASFTLQRSQVTPSGFTEQHSRIQPTATASSAPPPLLAALAPSARHLCHTGGGEWGILPFWSYISIGDARPASCPGHCWPLTSHETCTSKSTYVFQKYTRSVRTVHLMAVQEKNPRETKQ